MTTPDGMHPAFSGRHPKLFLISDLYRDYRLLTEIAEVHYTPVTLKSVNVESSEKMIQVDQYFFG